MEEADMFVKVHFRTSRLVWYKGRVSHHVVVIDDGGGGRIWWQLFWIVQIWGGGGGGGVNLGLKLLYHWIRIIYTRLSGRPVTLCHMTPDRRQRAAMDSKHSRNKLRLLIREQRGRLLPYCGDRRRLDSNSPWPHSLFGSNNGWFSVEVAGGKEMDQTRGRCCFQQKLV